MSKVRVWQSCREGGWSDWEMRCEEHEENVTSCGWLWAMEAAWGHIVMHHTSPPCEHEYGWYPVDRPEEHKCLDCGEAMPLQAEQADELEARESA